MIDPSKPPVKLFAAFLTKLFALDTNESVRLSSQLLSSSFASAAGKNLKLTSNVVNGSGVLTHSPALEEKCVKKSSNVVPD